MASNVQANTEELRDIFSLQGDWYCNIDKELHGDNILLMGLPGLRLVPDPAVSNSSPTSALLLQVLKGQSPDVHI